MADEVERFPPTGGRVAGAVALLMVALVVYLAFFAPSSSVPRWGGALALFLGVVSYAALLRPGVSLTDRRLVLRNMLETVSIPLVAVDTVVVRQYMAVGVGEKRYVSPAIGRSRRSIRREDAPPAPPSRGKPRSSIGRLGFGVLSLNADGPDAVSRRGAGHSHGQFVQDRIRHRAAEARLHRREDGEVQRTPDPITIGLLVLTGVATVVLLFLG